MISSTSPQRRIGIGLFGFGVVGSAVYQLLQDQGEQLTAQAGARLEVRRVLVRDLHKPRAVPVDPGLLTTDAEAILGDPEIDVVVEVMGGVEPTRGYVVRALGSGRSVVTANKELVADYSQELLALAQVSGADFYFEAAVGGGIPVLRPLLESLAAGRIRRIMGIVNGTTNYILEQMSRGGKGFATALAEAQALGYAEPDPTADVEGHDPARKVAILSSIAFRTHVKSTSVPAEGITRITPEDLAYGARRGWTLKLLAFAQRHDQELETRVRPVFLPGSHPLAGVGDAFNAIFVHGEEIGETMFYGRGAGGLPTGTAVVSDILEAARHKRLGVALSQPWAREEFRIRPPGDTVGRFYVRLRPQRPEPPAQAGSPAAAPGSRVPAAAAGPGPATGSTAVLTSPSPAIAAALADAGVPVVQHGALPGGEVVLETGPVLEALLLAHLEGLAGAVSQIVVRILD